MARDTCAGNLKPFLKTPATTENWKTRYPPTPEAIDLMYCITEIVEAVENLPPLSGGELFNFCTVLSRLYRCRIQQVKPSRAGALQGSESSDHRWREDHVSCPEMKSKSKFKTLDVTTTLEGSFSLVPKSIFSSGEFLFRAQRLH